MIRLTSSCVCAMCMPTARDCKMEGSELMSTLLNPEHTFIEARCWDQRSCFVLFKWMVDLLELPVAMTV